MPEPILQIENLSVTFRNDKEKVEAVKGLSFVLERGKTLGIVGESGSGKSVTALSILQLLPKDQASITADGILFFNRERKTDLLSLDEKKMREIRGNRVSMIFQEPMSSLNPVMRCGLQVLETLLEHRDISRKEAREKVLELFREVQLPRAEEIFRSYPHELSGGQKQRVMIAMAIACEPDILIADEPTTALDVTVQKAILDLICRLQEKYSMTVLFITHDLGLVSAIADDLVVMKEGRIVESGPARHVLNNPQHPYTRGLLACRPRLDTRPARLPTVNDFISNQVQISTVLSKDRFVNDLERERSSTLEPVLRSIGLRTWFPLRAGMIWGQKSFVKAVDGVTIDLYKGETLGLVGESGCGKTTLGRSVLRLIEPTGGKVIYKGEEITGLAPREMRRLRKQLQIIFQDPYSSLNPRMTAGRAIMEPMTIHKLHGSQQERKKKALELMERTGLDPSSFHRYPHEFSGGQRQRICIARALAVEPEVIICDEAVSALDVSVQAQVLNLLNDLKEEFGLTYLFISHDLSVVKFMSDRIIVMKDGKIEEEGSPEEIYHHPGSSYTKKLIDSILT